MSDLLSVDPGSAAVYYAYWFAGKLRKAGCVKGAPLFVASSLDVLVAGPPSCVVVEQMSHAGTRVPADSLLRVAEMGNFVAGFLRPEEIVQAPARVWKGSVPKEITQKRALAALSTQEQALLEPTWGQVPKSLHHNVWDAVGIGLWKLGRWYR